MLLSRIKARLTGANAASKISIERRQKLFRFLQKYIPLCRWDLVEQQELSKHLQPCLICGRRCLDPDLTLRRLQQTYLHFRKCSPSSTGMKGIASDETVLSRNVSRRSTFTMAIMTSELLRIIDTWFSKYRRKAAMCMKWTLCIRMIEYVFILDELRLFKRNSVVLVLCQLSNALRIRSRYTYSHALRWIDPNVRVPMHLLFTELLVAMEKRHSS